MATDNDALKNYLIGLLKLDYPYTNAELLILARSQGQPVNARDIQASISAIAVDIAAGHNPLGR